MELFTQYSASRVTEVFQTKTNITEKHKDQTELKIKPNSSRIKIFATLLCGVYVMSCQSFLNLDIILLNDDHSDWKLYETNVRL